MGAYRSRQGNQGELVRFFKPKPVHYLSGQDETELVRASRRVTKMPSYSIVDWCDEAGTAMARYLYDFRQERDATVRLEYISEVKESMIALQACVLELYLRAVAEHERLRG
jgi:hypothetical protein